MRHNSYQFSGFVAFLEDLHEVQRLVLSWVRVLAYS